MLASTAIQVNSIAENRKVLAAKPYRACVVRGLYLLMRYRKRASSRRRCDVRIARGMPRSRNDASIMFGKLLRSRCGGLIVGAILLVAMPSLLYNLSTHQLCR